MIKRTPFPVQRSLLSSLALAKWLSDHYDLAAFPTCRFWRRVINDLYLVEAGGVKLVLRVSPTGRRSWDQLAAEIDLLNFLDQKHIAVPRPVRRRDGDYIQTLNAPEGDRHAVVFAFVSGTPYRPTTKHARRFGQAIAQLHTVTDGYPANCAGFRFEFPEMVDRPLRCLKPLFVGHEDDLAYLMEISPRLKRAAERLSRTTPEYGICHGDVNGGNFYTNGAHEWALLDFEYFGYGWRVFDIATFFNNQIHQLGRTERSRGILGAFLEGYQAVRPLSQIELEVLPLFVALRQIWLLGIGAKNQPIIGQSLFSSWAFEWCMPFIRTWMTDPFWNEPG